MIFRNLLARKILLNFFGSLAMKNGIPTRKKKKRHSRPLLTQELSRVDFPQSYVEFSYVLIYCDMY